MRSIEDFKEEVAAHYSGPSFEVTVDRDPTPNSTGNGISYRSLYTILVCLNHAQDLRDFSNFTACMSMREVDGPGLYHRNPGDKTQNAIDDHFYAAAASSMLDPQKRVARAILNHYRACHGYFDDQNPGSPSLSSNLARYPWFYGYLKLCSGEAIGLLDRMILMGWFLALPKKEDAGAILMRWVMARMGYIAGGLCGRLAARAMIKLSNMYSIGLAGAAAAYFNRQGEPPHPLSWFEVWKDIEQV